MPFDPCREWLGIDASDLKDPHKVLAIAPTVSDGDAIARVAEERLAKLGAIAPGPFAKAHAALMNRVAEARDTLLATATWATASEPSHEEPRYTVPPPPQTIPSPPSPPQASAPQRRSIDDLLTDLFDNLPRPLAQPEPRAGENTSEHAEPPASPEPVAPAPSEYHPEPVYEEVHDHEAIESADAHYEIASTDRRSSSGGGAGLGLFAIFLAVVLAGGYYAYKKLGVAELGWEVALRSVIERQPDVPPIETVPPPTLPPSVTLPTPTESGEPVVVDTTYEPETADPTPTDPQTTSNEPPVSPPPSVDPAIEQRMAAERRQVVAQVEILIREAFDALLVEDFDAAATSLETAWKAVGDDVDTANRVERWRLLADYARAYSVYRAKAFKSAGSGREYEIDGKKIVVIEVTPRDFTYRLNGRNVTVSRKTMSPVLEVGIVESWFGGDGRAANYLFLGARWLCKEKPNHERARAAWQKAADGGENAAPLLTLLDDPVTQRPEGR